MVTCPCWFVGLVHGYVYHISAIYLSLCLVLWVLLCNLSDVIQLCVYNFYVYFFDCCCRHDRSILALASLGALSIFPFMPCTVNRFIFNTFQYLGSVRFGNISQAQNFMIGSCMLCNCYHIVIYLWGSIFQLQIIANIKLSTVFKHLSMHFRLLWIKSQGFLHAERIAFIDNKIFYASLHLCSVRTTIHSIYFSFLGMTSIIIVFLSNIATPH